MNAKQVAHALGIDVRTAQNADGSPDPENMVIRSGQYNRAKFPLFLMLTGLKPVGEVIQGKRYNWLKLNAEAFAGVNLDTESVVKLPVMPEPEKPSEPAVKLSVVETDEEDDEDEDEDDEDDAEDGEGD